MLFGNLKYFVGRSALISMIQTEPKRLISFHVNPLLIKSSAMLNAEPMKKKKRLDVSVIIQREQKKKRKLEKAIRRQESKGKTLKPIEELETERQMMKTIDKRRRDKPALTFEESERRAVIFKDWARYKFRQFTQERQRIMQAIEAQQEALEQLRLESDELYTKALQIDETLIPHYQDGPKNTPPVPDYQSPDGDYVDTVKDFTKQP